MHSSQSGRSGLNAGRAITARSAVVQRKTMQTGVRTSCWAVRAQIGWTAAENKELENHKANGSFELIDRTDFEREAPGRRLVKLVWVYKRKRNGQLKARLCVQGCTQQPGVDFDQTHCATLRGPSLRMLSALASKHNLSMRRWDFVSAFLQGDLQSGEVVYCLPPPGPYSVTGSDNRPRVWKVRKPVYI